MHYFQALIAECSELDRLAQEYLDTLEFLPNDEVCQRIWDKAKEIWNANGASYDSPDIPDWVKDTFDGCIPYTGLSRNGSLFYSLGFSVVSQDAHLRNLMERVEGRTDKELDFPLVVDENFFDKYEPPKEPKPKRKKSDKLKVKT